MNTDLQLLNEGKIRADVFFDRLPILTDWDKVRADIKSGLITREAALASVKLFEPLQAVDARDQAHWVAQQIFRLTLLHEARKPLELPKVCENCGIRKVDPVSPDYNEYCLHCAEEQKQKAHSGSRGNCEFLSVRYNPASKSWGLLQYWSHDRETFLFWTADFYPTRQAAEQALSPIFYYQQWLQVVNNGMITEYMDSSDLVLIGELMNMKLPLTPEGFREYLRCAIQKDLEKEHAVMGHIVRDAMREHDRKEDDDD